MRDHSHRKVRSTALGCATSPANSYRDKDGDEIMIIIFKRSEQYGAHRYSRLVMHKCCPDFKAVHHEIYALQESNHLCRKCRILSSTSSKIGTKMSLFSTMEVLFIQESTKLRWLVRSRISEFLLP